MSTASHQTISLSRGKHSSPAEGACVMELASMLAGEPFSDHPACVSPVIGALMRTCNDLASDDRRQELYAYASRVVGTHAVAEVEERRADRVSTWVCEMRERRVRRALPAPLARMACSLVTVASLLEGWVNGAIDPVLGSIGSQVIRALPRHDDQAQTAVLALVDELIALGDAAGSRAEVGIELRSARRLIIT